MKPIPTMYRLRANAPSLFVSAGSGLGPTSTASIHSETSDGPWDDFEATWRAGRQEWLLEQAEDPRASEVRDELELVIRYH
ncbi:hypothetical protein [Micromonospora sp. NPDC002717]|uniref:hypothetical protein n=1 Tax=Micromonospora sp. NPDC002717 TaxID=3154424 RepID=UPI0033233870